MAGQIIPEQTARENIKSSIYERLYLYNNATIAEYHRDVVDKMLGRGDGIASEVTDPNKLLEKSAFFTFPEFVDWMLKFSRSVFDSLPKEERTDIKFPNWFLQNMNKLAFRVYFAKYPEGEFDSRGLNVGGRSTVVFRAMENLTSSNAMEDYTPVVSVNDDVFYNLGGLCPPPDNCDRAFPG